MVLGLLSAIAACPAIIGTTEAVRQGQRQNAKQEHRGKKSNLYVTCTDPSSRAKDINGGTVVLRNNKLFVTTVNPKARYPDNFQDDRKDLERVDEAGHLFAGYFFPYPESTWGRRGDGFVSTISDEPPQLNWVYVDTYTFEVKYGLRKEAEGHIVGPWNCTPIDKRLTLDGWEGFTVVEEVRGSNCWALYYDVNDDGLEDVVDCDKRIMEVELTRREMRISKKERRPF